MLSRIGATVCGAAMILSLVGCEGLGGLVREPAKETAPGTEQEAPPPGDKEATMRPPRKPDTGDRRDARKDAPPGIALTSVMGGSEGDVTRFLGEPAAVRNEPPAMVWHYAAPACKLDVFFYFDIGNKDFRALAYKFYPDQATGDAERACVASIREAKAR